MCGQFDVHSTCSFTVDCRHWDTAATVAAMWKCRVYQIKWICKTEIDVTLFLYPDSAFYPSLLFLILNDCTLLVAFQSGWTKKKYQNWIAANLSPRFMLCGVCVLLCAGTSVRVTERMIICIDYILGSLLCVYVGDMKIHSISIWTRGIQWKTEEDNLRED